MLEISAWYLASSTSVLPARAHIIGQGVVLRLKVPDIQGTSVWQPGSLAGGTKCLLCVLDVAYGLLVLIQERRLAGTCCLAPISVFRSSKPGLIQ